MTLFEIKLRLLQFKPLSPKILNDIDSFNKPYSNIYTFMLDFNKEILNNKKKNKNQFNKPFSIKIQKRASVENINISPTNINRFKKISFSSNNPIELKAQKTPKEKKNTVESNNQSEKKQELNQNEKEIKETLESKDSTNSKNSKNTNTSKNSKKSKKSNDSNKYKTRNKQKSNHTSLSIITTNDDNKSFTSKEKNLIISKYKSASKLFELGDFQSIEESNSNTSKNPFLHKFKLQNINTKIFNQDEITLFKSLLKSEFSYENEYNSFEELFKKKPSLRRFCNPKNFSKTFKLKENLNLKFNENIKYYDKSVFTKLSVIKHNEEKISKWEI